MSRLFYDFLQTGTIFLFFHKVRQKGDGGMHTLWRRFRYRFFAGRQRGTRRKIYRHTIGGKLRSCFVFLLLIALLFGIFAAVRRVGTVGRQAAAAALNQRLVYDANAAVSELMQEREDEIRALTTLQKDESGAPRSMHTDYAAANRVKAELLQKIGDKLCAIHAVDTYIPVGLLFSDALYTGVGFHLPIRVFCAENIDVSFCDEFTAAGINQTRYLLLADITVTARVGGIANSEEITVTTQVPMTETILLGTVPDTYLSIPER